MAVGNGDVKTPQQDCMGWPQLVNAYAVSQGIETPQGAMQQTSQMLPNS